MDNVAAFIEGDMFFPVLCIVLVILVIVFIWVLVSGIIDNNKRKKRKVVYDQESEVKFFKDEPYNIDLIEERVPENSVDEQTEKPQLEEQNEVINDDNNAASIFSNTTETMSYDNVPIESDNDHLYEAKSEGNESSYLVSDDIYENMDKINGKNIENITFDDIADDVKAVEKDVIDAANAYISSVMVNKK